MAEIEAGCNSIDNKLAWINLFFDKGVIISPDEVLQLDLRVVTCARTGCLSEIIVLTNIVCGDAEGIGVERGSEIGKVSDTVSHGET